MFTKRHLHLYNLICTDEPSVNRRDILIEFLNGSHQINFIFILSQKPPEQRSKTFDRVDTLHLNVFFYQSLKFLPNKTTFCEAELATKAFVKIYAFSLIIGVVDLWFPNPLLDKFQNFTPTTLQSLQTMQRTRRNLPLQVQLRPVL